MARSLSHLTGHELAALAAPFESPRRGMFRRNPKADDLMKEGVLDRLKEELAKVKTLDDAHRICRKVVSLDPDVFNYQGGFSDAFVDGIFLNTLGYACTAENLNNLSYMVHGLPSSGPLFDRWEQIYEAADEHLAALERQANGAKRILR